MPSEWFVCYMDAAVHHTALSILLRRWQAHTHTQTSVFLNRQWFLATNQSQQINYFRVTFPPAPTQRLPIDSHTHHPSPAVQSSPRP